MPEPPEPNIYQLRVVLLGISPIIWRRLLVRGDSTIADLHAALQTAFGWSGDHLHRFLIHGKQYGVAYLGGITFRDDPRRIKLSDLGLRIKEKFLYEYDFNDQWRHLIRVEAIAADRTRSVLSGLRQRQAGSAARRLRRPLGLYGASGQYAL